MLVNQKSRFQFLARKLVTQEVGGRGRGEPEKAGKRDEILSTKRGERGGEGENEKENNEKIDKIVLSVLNELYPKR